MTRGSSLSFFSGEQALSLPGSEGCCHCRTGNLDDSTCLTENTSNSCWAPTQHGPNSGGGRGNGNGGDYSLFAESRGNNQGLVTLCYVAKGSGEVRSHTSKQKSK